MRTIPIPGSVDNPDQIVTCIGALLVWGGDLLALWLSLSVGIYTPATCTYRSVAGVYIPTDSQDVILGFELYLDAKRFLNRLTLRRC